jgi:hypothetical protein
MRQEVVLYSIEGRGCVLKRPGTIKISAWDERATHLWPIYDNQTLALKQAHRKALVNA